ncbi:MAG TPA: transporter substrate-binding domain-containing protein [Pseudoduganella sp.]
MLANEFLGGGVMRVAINLGNPILARRDALTDDLAGVSVDLAGELARRLKIPVLLVPFAAAGQAAQALANAEVNLAFLAIDPERSQGIRFSPAYVCIEGSYLVRAASPLRAMVEVDRRGMRIAVGLGSAYDLFLSRSLKHAEIVRAPTSPTVTDTFLEQNLDVAAGVRQQLESDARRHAHLRLLPGRFMTINQAMGLPLQASDDAWLYLCRFVEEVKRSGFVAAALARHNIEGAAVAPPAI